jgi:hypothetical protein
MGQGDQAVAFAAQQIGKPYVFGAAGPNSWDCSGLVVGAYKAATPPITLPHFTGGMIFDGVEVTRADLQAGDLVFPDSGHVQLYVGDGQVIEAPHTGANVRQVPMYGFWRGRRVATDGAAATGTPATTVSLIGSTGDLIGNATKALKAVISPTFWLRLGFSSLGVLVIFVGIAFLLRHKAAGAVASTVSTGAKLGEVAIGGAAVKTSLQILRPKRAKKAAPAKAAPVKAVPTKTVPEKVTPTKYTARHQLKTTGTTKVNAVSDRKNQPPGRHGKP